MKTHFAKN